MEDDLDVRKGKVRFIKPRACDIGVAVSLRRAAGCDREIIEGGEKYPVIGGEIRIEGEVEETEILAVVNADRPFSGAGRLPALSRMRISPGSLRTRRIFPSGRNPRL